MSADQPRKAAGFGVFLMILGGIVLFGIAGCVGLAMLGAGAVRATHRTTAASASCAQATSYEERAADDVKTGMFQMGYESAMSGLRSNANCNDDKAALVNRGYLMTMKAWSEHYLHQGDSVTDMNEATTLLQECQTTPGLYGTHIGALCETQQEANIREKDNWELNR